MWHWLRKKVFDLDYTMRFSIGLSSALHGILFIIMLYVTYASLHKQVIQVDRQLLGTSTPIIIIDPTASSVGVHFNTNDTKATATVQSNVVINAEPKIDVVSRVTETRMQDKKNNANRSDIKKSPIKKTGANKKSVKKSAEKKVKSTGTGKKKELTQKKRETQKPTAKVPRDNEQQKKVHSADDKKADNKKTDSVTEKNAENVAVPALQGPVLPEGPILVARSSSEAALLSLHMQVQDELLRVWHPPLGCESSISCHVTVDIDHNGGIKRSEVIQSSGVLLFDVSARAAIQQAVWPRGVWGTTVELVLQ